MRAEDKLFCFGGGRQQVHADPLPVWLAEKDPATRKQADEAVVEAKRQFEESRAAMKAEMSK
jgi:hypothetical protein